MLPVMIMGMITITTIEPLSTGASARHRTTLRDIGIHPHAHAGAHTHTRTRTCTHTHAFTHCAATAAHYHARVTGLAAPYHASAQRNHRALRGALRVLGHRTCGALPCEYSVSTPSTHRALGVLITEYTNGNHRRGPRSRAKRNSGESERSRERHTGAAPTTAHITQHQAPHKRTLKVLLQSLSEDAPARSGRGSPSTSPRGCTRWRRGTRAARPRTGSCCALAPAGTRSTHVVLGVLTRGIPEYSQGYTPAARRRAVQLRTHARAPVAAAKCGLSSRCSVPKNCQGVPGVCVCQRVRGRALVCACLRARVRGRATACALCVRVCTRLCVRVCVCEWVYVCAHVPARASACVRVCVCA